MADSVAHRGPDGEGFAALRGETLAVTLSGGPSTPAHIFAAGLPYTPLVPHAEVAEGARVILAHRRLSIVDLSAAGHQPMCFGEAARYWVAYNGEIYNHRELRAELEACGHHFVSHSDTEVLLASYAQWGEACLERFNGMFAFVLIDRARQELFAARDRFGVKPLYYWISPDGFLAFASEIKQFTVLPGWRARLDHQRAYDFLAWGLADHEAGTLFAGVHQLRGGQCLLTPLTDLASCRAGEPLTVRTWYCLPETAEYADDFDQAAAHFGDLLNDSVRLRLRSDVPVGSCLSGGLDSSSIVCVMHRLLAQSGGTAEQLTFTAHAGSGRLDERPYANAVVRATGVHPHYVSPTAEQLFEALDRIAWHQDEPFGSTSIFVQWKVFELAAAQSMKVMLDGQGADEALGGYPVFWGARLAGLARALRLPTLASELAGLEKVQGRPVFDSMRQMVACLLPGSWIEVLRGAEQSQPTWLDRRRWRGVTGNPLFRVAGSFRASVRALSRAQLMRINLPLLLHWEDRSSMAHAVEARVPFLDYRLVEFALSLPDRYKLQGGWTKRVLRAAVRDILPTAVAERSDKIGFEAPDLEWMRGNAALFRAGIERAALRSGGLIRCDSALQLFDRMVAKEIPYSSLPWRLVSFGVWAERFSVDCG